MTLEVGVKAFIRRNSRYLILHRAKPYPKEEFTRWDIPGGRITPGEPLQKALKREVKEETGLTLTKIADILAVQDIMRVRKYHTVRITFLAEGKGGVRINPKEHSEFRWLTRKALKKLRHDKYLTPVINELGRKA